jgi:hypothetical protein
MWVTTPLDEIMKTTVKRATVAAKIWTRDLRGSRSPNPSYIKLRACSLAPHSDLITCVVESSGVFNSRPTLISVLNYAFLAHIYDRSGCPYHDTHLSLVLVNGLGARDTGMSSWRYTGSGATYIPRGAVRVAATDPVWIYTCTSAQPYVSRGSDSVPSVDRVVVQRCNHHNAWQDGVEHPSVTLQKQSYAFRSTSFLSWPHFATNRRIWSNPVSTVCLKFHWFGSEFNL